MSGPSGDDATTMARKVLAGNWRAAAKFISRIESGDEALTAGLNVLYAQGARVPVIGITGPPGAGKSTLVDQLIGRFRSRGQRVAVLAVDPTSPFTGGAILGDRVRMGRHAGDSAVFIRSMAARGSLGGLAAATGDALTVLDAMGVDRILVETVGVGQNEIDILRHAQTVLIVQAPASGDSVQAAKAGLLEIGDLLVVNKSDLAGSDRAVSALRESIELRSGTNHGAESWQPPVLKTQASNGDGIDELVEAIDAHQRHLNTHTHLLERRLRTHTRALLIERIAEALRLRYGRQDRPVARFEYWLGEIMSHRCHPSTAVSMLLDSTAKEGSRHGVGISDV